MRVSGLGWAAAIVAAACGVGEVTSDAVELDLAGADAGEAADAQAPSPASPCKPEAGGPYWLTEGETLRLEVRCSSGLQLPGEAFAFPALPRGAQYDPTSRALTWNTRLDQAAVHALRLEVPRTGEHAQVVVGVVDRFWDSGNSPVRDFKAYPEEFGVPVIHVRYSGSPSKETLIPAQVTYRGREWAAQVRLHGVTSLEYPKKSYGLRFDASDPFSDPERGFTGRTKIRLTTTFDDNSYLRQRLAYQLWNRMDPSHIQVGAFNAVVFLNGRYWGLYTLSDDVDKPLIRAHGLPDGGNLYKAFSNDANFGPLDRYGLPKDELHQGYQKKEGEPPGDFSDLDALVGLVANAGSAEFSQRFPQLARATEFQDWWILVTFLLAGDNVRKNYYLYDDRKGGPWRFVPWDFNGSLGQSWHTTRESSRIPEYRDSNRLFDRMLDDPAMGPQMRRRFHDVLRGPWEQAALLALLDGYVDEVRPAATRDEIKWSAAYRAYEGWSERTDFLDFEGEAAYVRRWLASQWRKAAAKY